MMCVWLWLVGVVLVLLGDFVYQFDVKLIDQCGQVIKFDVGCGELVLVSMFYMFCQFVCFMLIDVVCDMQVVLSEVECQYIKVLLISFDFVCDIQVKLDGMVCECGLDVLCWMLVCIDLVMVCKIVVLLKFQYCVLLDGEFNYSVEFILFDGEGCIVVCISMLVGVDVCMVIVICKQLVLC